MIEWKKPLPEDLPLMRSLIGQSGAEGSDANAANIFLLREKYNIKIAFAAGSLLRLYTGTRLPGRSGVTFPLGGDTEKALDILEEDRQNLGKPARFIFLTEQQRDILARRYPEMRFETTEDNSDYMYTASHLSELAGKKNMKKRNHVSRFCREYPDYEIRFLGRKPDEQLLRDITDVEEKWFALQTERVDSSFVERLEIYEACRLWDVLELYGAVIYVAGEAAAMTIASQTSPGCFDIHFEKCYGDYAQNGGFAMINKSFAQIIKEQFGAEWINREEDIGLAGLRKAKLSYHPDKMLRKYHTVKEG
ncbi:MAG: DUF2156 domain-containing protein [Ruminococcus sp.]|nr:DUF2156 domain-containing protein [Ruminococcus sp.]